MLETISPRVMNHISIIQTRWRFTQFAKGDMDMARIHPECLPSGTHKKLHPRNGGPYNVMKKVNSNAYVLYSVINSTFNVKNLTLYRG